jgi:hypothetical protein
MSSLNLLNLRSRALSEWLREPSEGKLRLFVATSGYEKRATEWMRRVLAERQPSDMDEFFVVGFDDFADALSRPANDEFYTAEKLEIANCGSSRATTFTERLVKRVDTLLKRAALTDKIEVHIDYSCMPRRWYCPLPKLIEARLREQDTMFFWYTPGLYPETGYPTGGTTDFKIFSGRASLSAKSRTHVFGLGFDRVRSQAIWSVLDPQSLVCFYADPAAEPSYVGRVKKDNQEALDAATYTFTVPVDDFATTFSRIRSVVFQFRVLGDVVIVPDGPKPLVFASSLVPFTIEEVSGVVCLHVSKRKPANFVPVDVLSAGAPTGFSAAGARKVANVVAPAGT